MPIPIVEVIIKKVIEPVTVRWARASTFDQSTEKTITTSSPAQIIVAANARRNSVLIQNTSSNPCYIGNSSVTSSNGYRLGGGSDKTFDRTTAAIYGISTGGNATIRVIEL